MNGEIVRREQVAGANRPACDDSTAGTFPDLQFAGIYCNAPVTEGQLGIPHRSDISPELIAVEREEMIRADRGAIEGNMLFEDARPGIHGGRSDGDVVHMIAESDGPSESGTQIPYSCESRAFRRRRIGRDAVE